MPLATRNVIGTKRVFKNHSKNPMSVIIPAAGMGHRMKSYGPKALINLYEDTTIIERQIEIIWSVYPKCDIFIVIGFEADKVRERLKNYPVRFIHNPIHAETNVLYSISLALQACISDEILICYGDLVFNEATIKGLRGSSCAIVDKKGMMKKDEVGLILNEKKITNFSFGLDLKWCHIAYLKEKELSLFKTISLSGSSSQWFGYEALNYILDNGGTMMCYSSPGMKIFEVDSAKDLEKIPKNKLTLD